MYSAQYKTSNKTIAFDVEVEVIQVIQNSTQKIIEISTYIKTEGLYI